MERQTQHKQLILRAFVSGIGAGRNLLKRASGGRGGIRTHGTLAGTPVFKTGALNHSATLPTEISCGKVVPIASDSSLDEAGLCPPKATNPSPRLCHPISAAFGLRYVAIPCADGPRRD